MSRDLVLAPTRVLDADEAHHLGQLLASSGYFADAREAAQAAVKVMAGAELGLGPVASMRGVDIIKGEVSLGAGLVAALVRRSERYDYDIRRWDDEGCEIVFTRDGKELQPPSTFTQADAQRADLIRPNRDGSPGAYQKYPRNMYFARAMTNGARLHCPDLFAGSVYTSEELGAPVEADVVDAVPEPSPRSAPAAPPPRPSSAPEAAPSSGPDGGAQTPSAVPEPSRDSRVTPPARSAPAAADGTTAAPSAPATPAQIMALKGFGDATQRMMLIEVGVEDVGDLDAAYASLTDEQQDKLIAMAQTRAS